jgi:GNAT superfamily N-acetyltransferase
VNADAPAGYRFGPDYEESVRLPTGLEVRLRLVSPADKPLLKRGMDAFSAESRYRRFLIAKRDLSDEELRYLTEVDGVDHFAIGALVANADGSDDGVAVARFVRFEQEREVAEPTIAVADPYQGLGLGALLFGRLMDAARERGIARFHGRMLAGNEPMRRILERAGRVAWHAAGQLTEFDLALDGDAAAQVPDPEGRPPDPASGTAH